MIDAGAKSVTMITATDQQEAAYKNQQISTIICFQVSCNCGVDELSSASALISGAHPELAKETHGFDEA